MSDQKSRPTVELRELKETFLYDATPVVTFSASYPEISGIGTRQARRINAMYAYAASKFHRYAAKPFYRMAVQGYQDAIRNDYPFRAYDAVMKSTVTYLDPCLLSTYTDRYEYTGGAHGTTLRLADTWDLRSGFP
ncbi:DUF4163 domain-containing protein, partial [Oscillospiraceae bacterium OttesenSCG-928-F05]|nr:DUF4163 domain-containing protein [Oscillospiraceae bacterium OttesenSCG-928-F05]